MEKEKRDQVFIAFIIIGVVGVILANTISGAGTLIILGQASVFLLIMYVVFYVIPYSFKKYTKWKNTPRLKNIKLITEVLGEGKTAFLIRNKEFRKPSMFISRIQIADNPLSWFPISLTYLSLKANESAKLFFLTWDKQHRYYYFSDFTDSPIVRFLVLGYISLMSL